MKLSSEPENIKDIIDKLQKMFDEDQAMRNSDTWDESIDHRNTERLKSIIDEIGWPTISKVGEKSSNIAWCLAQHADHDLSFQKRCLELMKSVPEGDISKRNIAYLEDRIAVAEGRPQLYGTQFYTNAKGELVPQPIYDFNNINKRRTDMGLETFEEYQKRMLQVD